MVKSLALGGMALGGTDGVVHVLRSMLAGADLFIGVDGYPLLADLSPDALRHVR
jgi:lactate 2-monooxygenase